MYELWYVYREKLTCVTPRSSTWSAYNTIVQTLAHVLQHSGTVQEVQERIAPLAQQHTTPSDIIKQFVYQRFLQELHEKGEQ